MSAGFPSEQESVRLRLGRATEVVSLNSAFCVEDWIACWRELRGAGGGGVVWNTLPVGTRRKDNHLYVTWVGRLGVPSRG